MKYLKIFESWYDEYAYEFSDKGFELDSTDGENKTLSGKYKGKYLITDINDQFIEMILRMSDDYNILRTKTYFNSTTDNANFEVEVSDKFNEDNYIIINKTDGDIKWFPTRIKSTFNSTISNSYIMFSGRINSGANKDLHIIIGDKGLGFALVGLNTKRPKIDKENLLKLFNMIDNGVIENNDDDYEDIKKLIMLNLNK